LTVSKQETQKLGVARFNLKEISAVEFRNKNKLRSQGVLQLWST